MSESSPAQPLRVYAYTALYAAHDLERDLQCIAAASSRNNPSRGITGALVYDRGRFVQVVEGPEEAIALLVSRIRKDPRIADWKLLFDRPTLDRSMQAWSMQVLRTDTHDGLHQETLEAFRDQYVRAFRVDAEGFIRLLIALIQS